MIALVEPPTACSIRIALAKAAGVRMADGRRPSRTASTAQRPAAAAAVLPLGYPAGIVPEPGIISPSVSARMAMVEAVPIVLQVPVPQARQRSRSRQPASSRRPARRSSQSRHRSLPVPMRRPRNVAGSREPLVTRTMGRSALTAPMIAPGTVLSQPASSTIPSSG